MTTPHRSYYAAAEPKHPSDHRIEAWCLALICGALLLAVGFVALQRGGPRLAGLLGLFDPLGPWSIPSIYLALQLLLIGVVFCRLSRRLRRFCRTRVPAAVGIGFLLLALYHGTGPREQGVSPLSFQPSGEGPLGGLILTILVFFAALNHRDVKSFWRHFRQESEIILAGTWMLLVGSVGLEWMAGIFLRSGAVPLLGELDVAIRAFFKMAGTSVILYGALRLALRLAFKPPAHPCKPRSAVAGRDGALPNAPSPSPFDTQG